MTISIIIPTLQESERIVPLVNYLKQEGGDKIAEIIVVDAGSTDNTALIAEKAGAKVILSAPGRAQQMNQGAKEAVGTVLYFVHADTYPPQNYTAPIQKALWEGWPMGCFRYRFDSPDPMLRINAWFTRFHFLFCQGGDKTFFIRKEIFQELGGYNEKHIVMEEYDFLQRAQKADLPFTVLKEAATVSARKYENRSWLKVQIANFTVFNLWKLKLASPQRLKSIYQKLLN